MARRRRSRSSAGSGIVKPLVVLALLVAAGWALWVYAPASWRAALRGEARPTSTITELPTPPRTNAAGEIDACALASTSAIAQALEAGSVDARHVGAGADVPAAGACTWSTPDNKASVIAMVFTRASLAQGGGKEFGAAYFRTVLTGLEYAFKEAPAMLPNIGDEAAVIGFGGDSGEPAQIVVRRGERVLHLVYRATDREHAVRVAQVLGANL
jgi:hypothetical protein